MAHTALQADLASGRLALVTTSTGARLALPPAEACYYARGFARRHETPGSARVEHFSGGSLHVNDYTWHELLGVQAAYSHPAGVHCGGWVRVFDPGATADDTLVACKTCPDASAPVRALFGR